MRARTRMPRDDARGKHDSDPCADARDDQRCRHAQRRDEVLSGPVVPVSDECDAGDHRTAHNESVSFPVRPGRKDIGHVDGHSNRARRGPIGAARRTLSPGCRAVELSRLRRGAVEALSRYCRGAVEALPVEPVEFLSSSCREPVEPVEPDSMCLGVEVCRGLSRSVEVCRVLSSCRAVE